jgi:signal transduction histidine kinase
MSPRKNAKVAFGCAVLVLLLSAIATYEAISRLQSSERWVAHSYQVQAALGDIDAAISKAGRARNSFLATQKPEFLTEFQEAIPQVQPTLQRLADLTKDNPRQERLALSLKEATNHRMALFQQAVALRQSSPNDAAGQKEISAHDLALAFEKASAMDQMRDEEQRLLQQRTLTSNRLFSLTVLTLAAAFILALVLFSVHYRLLWLELGAREQAERTARESEDSLRHLSSRLLHIQDEDRRKFSRELHDSLGQYLAGVKMNLDMFARTKPSDELLANAIELLDQSISETRTISHLLHPPLLDEVGFSSAAKWFVQGFSERSGLNVTVDIPDDLGRLSHALELGLFRVLQESLTNIHRHSRSKKAEVVLELKSGNIVLRIKDYGKGIPQELVRAFREKGTTFGVGLTGMRERARELGGHLEIESSNSGTEMFLKVPLTRREPQLSDVWAASEGIAIERAPLKSRS